MSNEFYKYIAKIIISFFQGKDVSLRPGDRYCLRLDNEEMVANVDAALREITQTDNIQGHYCYTNKDGAVYKTFTIQLDPPRCEVVIASQIDGMTENFLATLRNVERTEFQYPILTISYSHIDTIISATGDLSAQGMPFHTTKLRKQIEHYIRDADLKTEDRTLLLHELENKEMDQFSDQTSLFEYKGLMTIVGRGYVKPTDFADFQLFVDDHLSAFSEAKQHERLRDNHQKFDYLNQVFRFGNIREDLGQEFDPKFIDQLVSCKRANQDWNNGITYDYVLSSMAAKEKKQGNPLVIDDESISVYADSELEFLYRPNEMYFIKNDGETAARKRSKNILIFNPEAKQTVSLHIVCNIPVKTDWVEGRNLEINPQRKDVYLHIDAKGCVFAKATIKNSENKITYTFKICVINIMPEYLSSIKTCYSIHYSTGSRTRLRIQGVTKELSINVGKEDVEIANVVEGGEYNCTFTKTLYLQINEEAYDTDADRIDFILFCGGIRIPLSFLDEPHKPTELTGVRAFKQKFLLQRSYEYCEDGKIIMGTSDFYAKDPFKKDLASEYTLVQNGWLCALQNNDGVLEELPLQIPAGIKNAYFNFLTALRSQNRIPSLTYYSEDLRSLASAYVAAFLEYFSQIEDGETLSKEQNDVLKIGTISAASSDSFIAHTPLYPLNVSYQLALLDEKGVGEIRDDLVERLSSTRLIPYIRNDAKNLYHVAEQRHSPEWTYYAPIENKRYKGARNFVPKLVCEKIKEYKSHFGFLFDDIGNSVFCINLINMGDCREILQGIIRYYRMMFNESAKIDTQLEFVVHIYGDMRIYNEFSTLSDNKRLSLFLEKQGLKSEELGFMATVLTRKVQYYYCSDNAVAYQYAHIAFYEMDSSKNNSDSQMNGITTGVSLNGLLSGVPSVLTEGWYKTGFGTKYAEESPILSLAVYYNALFRVAFSGGSYSHNACMSTEIEKGSQDILDKIYNSSNWVVFVDPKVDLNFFHEKDVDKDLLIIHYSDQYTSASGYDAITVTRKSKQYEDIIHSHLFKKGVFAQPTQISGIIDLFNAVNGDWLLRLVSTKKSFGLDSNFSREKMSVLSALKIAMAYYSHPDIIWVPISLEEMLRVSGGAGLSANEGLLSAKNLGFENGPTCDDLLLVGIEGPKDNLKVYFHPIEVKIGINQSGVLTKAFQQTKTTHDQLLKTLWPDEDRNLLERKVVRNFVMQLIIISCEKMKLYDIYPQETWDLILNDYREALLNERYQISTDIDSRIGESTIISFKQDILLRKGEMKENACVLEFPEKDGANFMVLPVSEVEKFIGNSAEQFPPRLLVQGQVGKPSADSSSMSTDPLVEFPSDKAIEENSVKLDTARSQPKTEQNSALQMDSDLGSSGTKQDRPELSNGIQVLFGTDQSNGQPLFWYPNDTDQVLHTNTGIIGTMGTGKTQFTKSLITQLHRKQASNVDGKNIGILIFDYKGDYNAQKEDFIAATSAQVFTLYNLPFNPLSLAKPKTPKHLLPAHVANTFADTIARVYHIGPKQRAILLDCIERAYIQKGISKTDDTTWVKQPPTFSTVYQIYINDESIKKNDSLEAALNKINMFQLLESDASKTLSLFDLLQGVVVIDLSGFDSDLQNLVVAITLDLFYSQMQAGGHSKIIDNLRQLSKFILVDEADNFLHEGFPSMKKILKEGREFGVGTILSTQFLKHFMAKEDDFSKYILTWVVHSVADLDPSDIRFVFNTDVKGEKEQELYNAVKKLSKHFSIVKMGNSSQPYYIYDKAFWELLKELEQ